MASECCDDANGNVTMIPMHDTTGNFAGSGESKKYFEIPNYMANEIKDPEEWTDFFDKYPFIPYAGIGRVTAHALLQRLLDFKHLSVTQGSCVESKKTYAFGGNVDIIKSTDGVFELDEDLNLGIPEKKIYTKFLENISLGEENWRSIREKFSESIDLTGNEWMEVVLSDTIGQKTAAIHHHKATDVLYYYAGKNAKKMAAVSCQWDEAYLRKNPPQLIPIFPFFTEMADGTLRSLHHTKMGDFRWYGRPPAYSAFVDMYTENRQAVYLSKMAHKGFTAQAFIELPSGQRRNGLLDDVGARDHGFKNASDRLEHHLTSKGNEPSQFIVTERPSGADRAWVHEFNRNLNEKYFKEIGELNARNIARANHWPVKLLDMDGATGFSEAMYLDIFKIKTVTEILRRQRMVDMALNNIVHEIARWMGRKDILNYSQKSNSPIQNLLNELDTRERDSITNASNPDALGRTLQSD